MACSGSSQAENGTGRLPCLRRVKRSSSAAATIVPSTTSAAAGSWKTALMPRTRMGVHYPGEALLTPPDQRFSGCRTTRAAQTSPRAGLTGARGGNCRVMTQTTTRPATEVTAGLLPEVDRAREAAPGWRRTSPAERAGHLREAATAVRGAAEELGDLLVRDDRAAGRRGKGVGAGRSRPPRRGGGHRAVGWAGARRRRGRPRPRAPGAAGRRRGHHALERPLPGGGRPGRRSARHRQRRRPQALGAQRRPRQAPDRAHRRLPTTRCAGGARGGCRRRGRARPSRRGRHGRAHREQRRGRLGATRLRAAGRRLRHRERRQGRAARRRRRRPGLGRRAGRRSAPSRTPGSCAPPSSGCTSTQTVADAVLDGLVERAEALVVGDPANPTSTMAPLVDARALDTVDEHVRQALDRGARLLTGGRGSRRPHGIRPDRARRLHRRHARHDGGDVRPGRRGRGRRLVGGGARAREPRSVRPGGDGAHRRHGAMPSRRSTPWRWAPSRSTRSSAAPPVGRPTRVGTAAVEPGTGPTCCARWSCSRRCTGSRAATEDLTDRTGRAVREVGRRRVPPPHDQRRRDEHHRT